MYKKLLAMSVALIGATLVALVVAGVGSSSGPPQMPTARQLALVGVKLGAPTHTPPGKAIADAAGAAASKLIGASVVNSKYAKCHTSSDHPPINQDCFVELMDARHVSDPNGGGPVSWEIVLVDPATQKPLTGFFEAPHPGGRLP